MHVFTTVKGVTKTDILCAVIEHNAQNMQTCLNSTKMEQNQTKNTQPIWLLQH